MHHPQRRRAAAQLRPPFDGRPASGRAARRWCSFGWWLTLRPPPPAGWPGRWRAWRPARPPRRRRPPGGLHARGLQLVVQRAQRRLAGADDHRVDREQPRLAVDAGVQPGVVDLQVLDAVDHLHAAALQRQAVRPAGGAAQRLAHGRRSCAAAAITSRSAVATCGTTPVTPPRGWFSKSMPHSRANTSMSSAPEVPGVRDQFGHVEADAAGAHDRHALADRLAAEDGVDVAHHLGVVDARDRRACAARCRWPRPPRRSPRPAALPRRRACSAAASMPQLVDHRGGSSAASRGTPPCRGCAWPG